MAIPVRMDLGVRLAAKDHRFEADLEAHLTLTARAMEPLRVFIEVDPPRVTDIDVDIKAQGLRASILDRVADIEGELKRVVARHIGRQIDAPNIRAMRDIDVAAKLNRNLAP